MRIWIDDHNPIFRLGLGACLEPPFLLAGESARFSPEPDLTRTDILVFELDAAGLPQALRLAQDCGLLLVTIAGSVDDELLVEAIEAGVTGALLRGETNPATFLHTLRSAAAGNGSLPTAVLGRLLARPLPQSSKPGESPLKGKRLAFKYSPTCKDWSLGAPMLSVHPSMVTRTPRGIGLVTT